jgi:hypothetical protein
LVDLVRQGSRQLSHGGHSVDVCEIHLRLTQHIFPFFRLLCSGDIHDGPDKLEAAPFMA